MVDRQQQRTTQQALVNAQFGARADAYVASPVHASGPDLDWMEAAVRGRGHDRLLDVGCGGGHVAYRLSAQCNHVVACDLVPAMLAAVEAEAGQRGIANIETIAAPAERLPFADAMFDCVASRFSAHHWGDLTGGLREAARVLKPGRQALFVDGRSPGLPLLDTHLQAIELLRDPSHVRDYATAEWLAALEGAGFVPVAVVTHQLRMDFAQWIARMHTPPAIAQAIRYLQDHLPEDARRHFAVEPDGSFLLDTLWIEARRR
jgi:ubiquinone/menaquinone biosynthesis C-methylase UbiE